MALNIDGTTGISGVDGSASAPALQGTDSNTGINFASDTVNINTGGSTRATVDSAGRLLLGTTDIGSSGVDNLILNRSGNGGLTIRNGVNNNGNIFFSDGTSGAAEYAGYFQYQHAQDTLVIGTSGSERMRIDSSGRLLLGDTSPTTGVSTGHIVSTYNGNSDNGIKTRDTSGGSCNHAVFVSQSTAVGTISGTSSAVAYNNLSDYRTKENDVKISDGITKLKLLRPIRFNFKHVPDTTVDGFFAHEVTPAVPEAVTGEKDAVDSNGEINPQMLDSSKLVPLLTAALQEAVAKIEVLETKVAALEAG